ncbi:MAG: hypothetical protein LCH54_12285 [Bacteroidetes bacterium]|nr:hypothetical protein [Bacteroidota bacterium]
MGSADDIIKIDLKDILRTLFEKKIKIVAISFGIAVIFALLSLLITNKYSATVTILPNQSEGGLSQFSSVASLVGINLSGSTNSDQLYPDIVFSERLLDKLINEKWKFYKIDTLTTLYEIYEIEYDSTDQFPAAHQRNKLLKTLREDVFEVEISKNNGVIRISAVVKGDPEFGRELVNRAVFFLDQFNRETRKTKSTEEMIFLESRVEEVYDSLLTLENELKYFDKNNRNWTASPDLRIERQQLIRQIEVTSTIWIELKKQYELVKLNTIREKITFDVLDYSGVPTLKTSPKRGLLTIFIFIFSMLITSAYFLYGNKIKYFIVELKNDSK